MSAYKTVEYTIGTQVAEAGTFVVPYPTNRDAGFYRNAFGHRIVTEQNDVYEHPADFTVSHGATGMTVTWATARVLAAQTLLYVQFCERADQDFRNESLGARKDIYRARPLMPVRLDLGAPDVADADGYCASQDLTSAGAFSVSTTAAAAIAAAALAGVADVPRNVVAAWTGAAVLTITGKDEYGNTMVESSSSGTTFTGKKAFKQVTGISSSANITALTVGTGDVLGLPIFVPTIANVRHEMKDGVVQARVQSNVFVCGKILEAAVDAATPLNLVAPVAGRIKKVSTIASATVTTGGAFTVEVNTVAVNGLSVVVADGAVEGEVDSDEPTVGHATAVVAAGDRIEIIPAAGFNASADFEIVIEIEPTVALNGTFVAGVATEPSATSGDVRGTYDPYNACDGSLEFALYVDVEDPNYLGLDQYAG